MTVNTPSPTDRASFNGAMTAVLADHATLRRLAVVASKRSGLSADDVLSMSEVMAAHEITEARLFDLPFLTRTPKTVTSTAARARRRCLEYTSGNFHLPDSNAAAALFIEALLAHLAVEEAWFAKEQEHQKEHMLVIA
ncbi:MAG: hypothetical protein Q8L56_01710 [Rhodocyclaceae bacterium]|nr:hypothetical protein [Rhodocyclaceae bacterium]